jgi:hypothetical protein
MKYTALTPKKTMNRNTLAAEIVVGIVSTLYLSSGSLTSDCKEPNFLLTTKQRAIRIPDSKSCGARTKSLPFCNHEGIDGDQLLLTLESVQKANNLCEESEQPA